jgi:hypothetical protein
MASFIVSDIGWYLGIALGLLLSYLLVKARWFHVLALIIFVAGMGLWAFGSYMFFFPLFSRLQLADTNWVFTPFLIGSLVWIFVCLKAFSQQTFLASGPR